MFLATFRAERNIRQGKVVHDPSETQNRILIIEEYLIKL